jgi:hypothetical protein
LLKDVGHIKLNAFPRGIHLRFGEELKGMDTKRSPETRIDAQWSFLPNVLHPKSTLIVYYFLLRKLTKNHLSARWLHSESLKMAHLYLHLFPSLTSWERKELLSGTAYYGEHPFPKHTFPI